MENLTVKRNVRISTGLHPAVYAALATCLLWFLAAIWGFFARGTYSALQLAICTVFGALFVGVPWVLSRQAGAGREKSAAFGDWLNGEIETAVGAIEARHAVAMILSAPVACATGITLMGVILRLA
jgi:hypothetical protein